MACGSGLEVEVVATQCSAGMPCLLGGCAGGAADGLGRVLTCTAAVAAVTAGCALDLEPGCAAGVPGHWNNRPGGEQHRGASQLTSTLCAAL